jgi:putative ABC transport system permease protein
MLKNYLKIAYRNLLKNKVFSLINIAGFSLGFIAAIFIAMYVIDELSFDQYNSKADRIYRVTESSRQGNGEQQFPATATLVAPAALENIPEVENAVRMNIFGRLTLGYEDFRAHENFLTVDSSFFQIFDCRFIEGNPEKALNLPFSVVLTETLAKKYFGNEPALGKSMYASQFEDEVLVTGVIEDFPSNAHFSPSLLFSMESVFKFEQVRNALENDWTSNEFGTYLLLDDHAKPEAVADQLTALANANRTEEFQNNQFSLQPLKDIHFYSQDLENDYSIQGDIAYVYIFSGIGLLILLIAFINYVNLSTARAMKRSKEVGLRKTVGASRRQLRFQFVGESLLIVMITLVLAITVVQLLTPAFNQLSGKSLQLEIMDPLVLGVLFAIGLTSGTLAGAYPAFYLSRIRPALILKQSSHQKSSHPLRKALVVIQFAMAVVLIISTVVIYQQMNFIQKTDLGYERAQRLTVDINTPPMWQKYEDVKAAFEQLSGVENVTVTNRVPGEWKSIPSAGVTQNDVTTDFLYLSADEDFLPTYGIELLAGRNFRQSSADSAKVLLNETALDMMGLDDPVGQMIDVTHFDDDRLEQPFVAEVIGIIEDVHFESVRNKVSPTMITYYQNPLHRIDYYTLQISPKNVQQTLADIEEVALQFDPESPLEYHFLDDKFAELYQKETKTARIVGIAAIIAILIASLGLFGLTQLTVAQKTKEVGIRKVLGADVLQITWLIARKFLVLVGIAFVIAAPFAWWTVQSWLQEFAYHVDMSVQLLLISGALVLLIALLTIAFQTIKAAMANPAKSLRYE